MSTLSLLDTIVERPSILGPDREERDHSHEDVEAPIGGPRTLDDLLTGTWETLTSGDVASCLLCDGPIEPRYGAGPVPVAGRCTRCGSEIS